jgi:hypothetical protein
MGKVQIDGIWIDNNGKTGRREEWMDKMDVLWFFGFYDCVFFLDSDCEFCEFC